MPGNSLNNNKQFVFLIDLAGRYAAWTYNVDAKTNCQLQNDEDLDSVVFGLATTQIVKKFTP